MCEVKVHGMIFQAFQEVGNNWVNHLCIHITDQKDQMHRDSKLSSYFIRKVLELW